MTEEIVGAIPSMWRVELLHPLTAHFPIALLVLATFLSYVILLLRPLGYESLVLKGAAFIEGLLFFGVVGAWIAIYTGGLAEEVVNRKLCDPTMTHDHEDLAYFAGYAYSVALALSLGRLRLRAAKNRLIISRIFFGLGLVAQSVGLFFLIQASHLGAKLVYQQGAAVYHPSAECREFE